MKKPKAKFWRDGWGTPIAYYEQAKLDAWLAEVAQKLHGLADFINENPNQDTETLQELEQMNCFDCKHHQLVKNKWCCLLDGKKLENYYGGCKKIEELEVEGLK